MKPVRPHHAPQHAELCLEALARRDLGDRISLGGAFGLLHYHDYRPTGRDRARLAVETHLTRIVQYRPLDAIADSHERENAAQARAWYREELLDALLD